MKTLIHLCKKDFAFAKHWLIGSWLALAFVALLPVVSDSSTARLLLILNMMAPPLLAFAATLAVMRADPLTGSNGFMGTRPPTGPFLLCSKLASSVVFVLIPAVLASLLGAFSMRVDPSLADLALLVMEKSLDYGLAISVGMLVGTFTRSIGMATVLTIVLGALMVWLFAKIHGRPGAFRFIADGRDLKTSQWLVTQALVPLSAIGITWFWMAWRRPAWTCVVAALALGSGVCVGWFWQGNFVRILAKNDMPCANRALIEWLGEPTQGYGRQNGIPTTMVMRPARVVGIADGWLGNPSGYHSVAQFPDGTKISSEGTASRTYGDFTLALLPSLGVALPPDHPSQSWSRVPSTWFRVETSRIQDLPDRRAKITGVAIVEIHQPVVLATLPPVSGASAVRGRFRYRIERIDALEGRILVRLRILGMALASRGDDVLGIDDIEIILIDPATGEHTVPGSSGGSSSNRAGLQVIDKETRLDDWPPGKKVDPADEFLKRARLFVIGRNHGGTVRVPFEMTDVDLESKR